MNKKGIKTTVIGIIAIAGLAYNAYLNGGFSVTDFLTLVLGVGFIFAKDADQSHTKDYNFRNEILDNDTVDPDNPKTPKKKG